MEAGPTIEQLEIRLGDGSVEHVFVNVIPRAGMHQQHPLLRLAFGQVTQPFQAILTDLLHRPAHDGGGIFIEPLQDGGVSARAVVVADQREPSSLHHLVHTTRRIAAVTDDVAEAEGLIDRGAIFEHGLESLPVGVNVRQDGDLHAGFPYRRG